MDHKREEEFLKWYDQFADVIFRHCFFRLSDREKAKDVTQEVFVRLWGQVVKGESIENARALLYRIAHNLIIDEYRKKKTVSLDVLREEFDFDVGYEVTSGIEARDLCERVRGEIEKLPETYREALVMRHIDGLSVKEIAHITGDNENAISVRIHRALEKLKIIYDEHNA